MTEAQTKGQRRWRNYLLDKRFQFKHIGMVMAVVLAVATVLGYYAYDYSQGQSEALAIQMAMQPDLNPQVAHSLEEWARDQDRTVALGIVLGILLLVSAMGVTGLVITHRVVGPVYKMKRLLTEVGEGNLCVEARFRRGDEMQDLGEAFSDMVASLRSLRESDLQDLDAALQELSSAQIPAAVHDRLNGMRERIALQLTPPSTTEPPRRA